MRSLPEREHINLHFKLHVMFDVILTVHRR